MPNMDYCKYQNTLEDLRQCWDEMDEVDGLSVEEARARKNLISLCKDIANNFDEDEN